MRFQETEEEVQAFARPDDVAISLARGTFPYYRASKQAQKPRGLRSGSVKRSVCQVAVRMLQSFGYLSLDPLSAALEESFGFFQSRPVEIAGVRLRECRRGNGKIQRALDRLSREMGVQEPPRKRVTGSDTIHELQFVLVCVVKGASVVRNRRPVVSPDRVIRSHRDGSNP